jgi:hypothetical protein
MVNEREVLDRLEKLEHLIEQRIAGGTPGLVQAGTATLVAGTFQVTNVTITATSRIIATIKDAHSGANANTAKLDVPAGTRVAGVGNGSFVINALTIADAVNNTDVSTVDWEIIG